MNKDKIKQGKWYETKMGVGECVRAGGCFPWATMIDITLPFSRGKLNFVPRDVIREVPVPMPKKADAIDKTVDAAVMARLRAPFGCEFIPGIEDLAGTTKGRWRIHDANDDAVASVAEAEEGYARLIVLALNEHFAKKVTNGSR